MGTPAWETSRWSTVSPPGSLQNVLDLIGFDGEQNHRRESQDFRILPNSSRAHFAELGAPIPEDRWPESHRLAPPDESFASAVASCLRRESRFSVWTPWRVCINQDEREMTVSAHPCGSCVCENAVGVRVRLGSSPRTNLVGRRVPSIQKIVPLLFPSACWLIEDLHILPDLAFGT